MSSSAISTQVAQLKIGNVQNQADTSAVYNGGIWSFKNSTALTSVTIDNSGNVGIGTASPAVPLDVVASNANALHLKLRGRASDNVGQMEFWNNANNTRYGYIGADSTAVNVSTSGALPLLLGTNATARVFISAADGSVGIGGSPDSRLAVFGSAGSNPYMHIKDANGADFFAQSVGNSDIRFGAASNHPLLFMTNSTARMRIDASGVVDIGGSAMGYGGLNLAKTGSLSPGVFLWINATATTQKYASFEYNGNGGSGSITPNGTGNVAFNTGPSDYRLKDEIEELSGGLEKIKSLRPVSFKWKKSGESDIGFIAHEIQQIIPQCVNGEKDAADEEGNPSYQSIFPAPAQMIANLVAAIQELSAKVDAQAEEIKALKAKP